MSIVFIFFYILGCWSLSNQNAYEIDCFIEFWKRSFNFKGITKRRNFWITQAWYLLHVILLVIFGIILFVDFKMLNNNSYVNWSEVGPFILIPIYAFSIVSFIPSISLQVRRLRDAAKNPLWILINFVPFIGGIVLLIFYLSPSKKRKIKNKLQDKLKEVENLLTQGTIDEEEYKYMRKKILTNYVD